ncbi:hypothetical protein [Actinomadura latina]|uniref:Integral membrane protein n=1 Tax=Actinomadura latina TaxID=163603 RepID=A0A846YW01_9ACTN|nr:hypothetical protein [Actinomadura latina]NKZ04261.1 hypothetical protein [Actinomadura latina]
MDGRRVDERRRTAELDDRERADYAGAVYGSLLAASVVVGASPRDEPAPAPTLVALLLATGLVFWLAHVYASLAGDRQHGLRMNGAEIRSAGRREWPLAQAAIPPAAAAAACRLADLSDAAASWTALFVALGGQVGWTLAAGRRAKAGVSLIVVSAVVNLLLGLLIVALKVMLTH